MLMLIHAHSTHPKKQGDLKVQMFLNARNNNTADRFLKVWPRSMWRSQFKNDPNIVGLVALQLLNCDEPHMEYTVLSSIC